MQYSIQFSTRQLSRIPLRMQLKTVSVNVHKDTNS